MKFQGLLDKIFDSGTDNIPVTRLKTKISKKHEEKQYDVVTITIGKIEYTFIKHDNGEWIRWSLD